MANTILNDGQVWSSRRRHVEVAIFIKYGNDRSRRMCTSEAKQANIIQVGQVLPLDVIPAIAKTE